MPPTKTKRIEARVSPEHDAAIRAAAARHSLSVTDFLIESALIRAETELADHRHIVLEPAAWDSLIATLDREPRVNERLARAIASTQAGAA